MGYHSLKIVPMPKSKLSLFLLGASMYQQVNSRWLAVEAMLKAVLVMALVLKFLQTAGCGILSAVAAVRRVLPRRLRSGVASSHKVCAKTCDDRCCTVFLYRIYTDFLPRYYIVTWLLFTVRPLWWS